MIKIAFFILGAFLQTAQADQGEVRIGIFSNNQIAVEISGEAVQGIKSVATSSKNIVCLETCRFDLDSNGKAQRPKLKLEEAPKNERANFSLEGSRNLKVSIYNASGDPNGSPLAKSLFNYLVAESQKPGSKVKGEAITNHDYAYTGVHLACEGYVSGDYLCELGISRSGVTKP